MLVTWQVLLGFEDNIWSQNVTVVGVRTEDRGQGKEKQIAKKKFKNHNT